MVHPLGMCLGSGVVEKAKHSGVPQHSGSGKERGPAKLMTQALLGGLAHTHTKRGYTGLVTGRQGYASQDSWQG